MDPFKADHVKSFIAAFFECALWAEHAYNAPEMEHEDDSFSELGYGIEEIAPSTQAALIEDCAAFLAKADPLDLQEWAPNQAGHDFWLTRNRHGAGFWDRHMEGLPRQAGQRLTDLAHSFGGVTLYVGDDGLIYAD